MRNVRSSSCLGHYAVHTPIEPPAGLPEKYRARRAQLYGDSETPTLGAPFDAISRARQDDADYAAMMENLDSTSAVCSMRSTNLDCATTRLSCSRPITAACARSRDASRVRPATCPGDRARDGSTRVASACPALFRWPAGLQPATTTCPVTRRISIPRCSTCAVCPREPTQCLDGRSLASALRGAPDASLLERPLAWYYPHDHGSGHRAGAAIRHGNWKLIHYLAGSQSELYDLASDPGESTNLSAKFPDRTRALLGELQDWIRSTNP